MARGLLRDLAANRRLGALLPGVTGPALARAAAEQGVGGLLLPSIERDRPAWAEPLAEALAARRRALLVGTLGQEGLAARCLSLLEARGIRALPLKGVALAETAYDVESDRPMSDVDLLALERWRGGLDRLAAAGFAVVSQGDHAWALRDPATLLVAAPVFGPGKDIVGALGIRIAGCRGDRQETAQRVGAKLLDAGAGVSRPDCTGKRPVLDDTWRPLSFRRPLCPGP